MNLKNNSLNLKKFFKIINSDIDVKNFSIKLHLHFNIKAIY